MEIIQLENTQLKQENTKLKNIIEELETRLKKKNVNIHCCIASQFIPLLKKI